MNNTFSIRGALKEASSLMKNRRWFLTKQYMLIAIVFSMAFYMLFGKGAIIASMLVLFIVTDWVLGYVRRGSFKFGELFENYSFKNFAYFCASMFLEIISVIGGLLLFIIPGIVFAVRLSFTRFVSLEQKLSPMAALKESKRLTKGYRWKLFLFYIVCSFINIVGLLCLIIGVFYTAPLTQLARGIVYKKLSSQATQPTA